MIYGFLGLWEPVFMALNTYAKIWAQIFGNIPKNVRSTRVLGKYCFANLTISVTHVFDCFGKRQAPTNPADPCNEILQNLEYGIDIHRNHGIECPIHGMHIFFVAFRLLAVP